MEPAYAAIIFLMVVGRGSSHCWDKGSIKKASGSPLFITETDQLMPHGF